MLIALEVRWTLGVRGELVLLLLCIVPRFEKYCCEVRRPDVLPIRGVCSAEDSGVLVPEVMVLVAERCLGICMLPRPEGGYVSGGGCLTPDPPAPTSPPS